MQDVATTHELVPSYGEQELEVLADLIASNTNSVVALVGERGLGKTTFGDRVADRLAPEDVVRMRCSSSGQRALLRDLSEAVGLPPSASEDELIEALKLKAPKLIWIDDATRMIRPLIGGLRVFDFLGKLATAVEGSTVWLLGIDSPAWNYLSRARGDRALLDAVVKLPEWSEPQIFELVKNCTKRAQLDLSYADLVVPRQLDSASYGDDGDHAEKDYSRLLWDFSDGNPLIATHFFIQSIRLREGRPHVRLFTPPAAGALEELPSSVYFVLRAVVQLGLARESDIAKCTGLPAPEVADALRLMRGRRYVEQKGAFVRVTIPWYRAIKQVLRRQHLLIG